MIAVDTNILLRYFAQDDDAQSDLATRLIEQKCTIENPCFVSLVVICELVWVLGRRYEMARPAIAGVLRELLQAPQVAVEHAAAVNSALDRTDQDIADVIIAAVARANGCSAMLTFDRRLARLDGVELLA